MKYINKFNKTEDFENAKSWLNELEHYVVYDAESKKLWSNFLKRSVTLHCKITEEMLGKPSPFGGKLPLLTRCDLFKKVKINGEEYDLSQKERTPYEFKSELTNDNKNNIIQELSTLVFDFESISGDTMPLNEKYVLAIDTKDIQSLKEYNIEVEWADNIQPKSLVGAFVYDILVYAFSNLYFPFPLKYASCLFYGCMFLESIDLSGIITNKTVNALYFLHTCQSLKSVNLSNCDLTSLNDDNLFGYPYEDGCAADVVIVNNTKLNDGFRFPETINYVDLSKVNTSHMKDMSGMFRECKKLTTLDLSNFDTSNVTDISYMFYRCEGLTTLNVSNFDTSSVTEMGGLFGGCVSLTSVDLSKFNTNNVTNMSGMFSGCTSLTSIDLSNFNVTNVTSMLRMFSDCTSLINLILPNTETINITDIQLMFKGCTSLVSLDLSNFNTTNATIPYCMFSGCTSLASLDLSNFDASNFNVTENGLYIKDMFKGCDSLSHIKCTQNFKDWCLTNKAAIGLPSSMQEGGGGAWEIVK